MKQANGFQKKLFDTFRIEASERLKTVINGLLELEKTDDPRKHRDLIETLFRETHSLKGAARAVTSSEIERVARSLESIFASLKKSGQKVSVELLNVLHRAMGHIEHLLSAIVSSSPESTKIADAIVADLEILLSGEAGPTVNRRFSKQPGEKPVEPVSIGPSPETVRIAVAKLDSLLLQAEEMLSMKLAAAERSANLENLADDFTAWKRSWNSESRELLSIERFVDRNAGAGERTGNGHEISRFLEFVESSTTYLTSLEHRIAAITKSAVLDQRSLSSLVDKLLEDAKKAVLFPFSSLLETFPRLVRDLAQQQGKEVDLVMQGAEIEVDKRILEGLKDPFIHLMRNCLDHGIERPEERQQGGKSPRGTVTVSVAQKNGNKIEVTIADDGAGIDPVNIRTTAIKQGLLPEKEADSMTDDEALQLIFQSGISTSPMVTDFSGRGLGLAIVREHVEKLGGQLSVQSTPQQGTTFHLILPLTLVTFQGLLVRVGEQMFVFPASGVVRVARIDNQDVRTVENRETIVLDGEIVSLARMGEVLGLQQFPKPQGSDKFFQVVVVEDVHRRMAFNVDAILQEQEVLVKSLGLQLPRVRNLAGATILGSGKVVPILNVADLIKSAIIGPEVGQALQVLPETKEIARRRSVLVVEDSITARTLLRSILESAGYSVTTAVDGVDAMTHLRTGEFDIVVSDVDMPRMNGFDLTARIRADKKLSDLPIVLVTALESREDRERGVDVGANAYIVKRSFDQSNLLEVVRRLVG